MEHLIVRFSNRVPYRIERVGDRSFFIIPKAMRMSTLKFMKSQPQHVIKEGKSSWKVVGSPPAVKQRGGNNYRKFLSGLKRALGHVPGHELSRLPLMDLQKQPRVKDLYKRYFKNNPELINPRSIVNTVASDLLDYDNDTGVVRDSVADVRKKKSVPASTIPSLQVTRENEFDRILLLVFNRFLVDQDVPELFLKSNYFTLRPQMLQVYQDDHAGFRARVEQARDGIENQISRDYKTLVNETNRMYLARYPFEEVARTIGIRVSVRGFSASKNKLDLIKRHALTIPGASQKFADMEQMIQTYTATPESNFMSVRHFMPGLQDKMVSDSDFVQSILKNGSRSHGRVLAVLGGQSM